MKFTNEIDRNSPITGTEKAALGMFLMWPFIFIIAMTAIVGCKDHPQAVDSTGSSLKCSEGFPTVEKWWK